MMTYTEQDVEQTVERLLAEHHLTGALKTEQLNFLDQYHIGGMVAVDRTVIAMGLGPEDRVWTSDRDSVARRVVSLS